MSVHGMRESIPAVGAAPAAGFLSRVDLYFAACGFKVLPIQRAILAAYESGAVIRIGRTRKPRSL